MLLAAFETSTEWCSVALWRDGTLASIEARASNSHGVVALPMLQRLLDAQGLRARDIEAVAFGAGPGSFTGLRIACGLAQGLAFGNDVPVLGVSTLEALAEDSGADKVFACLDARMREVYCAALERDASQWRDASNWRDAGRWREVVATSCVPPADAPAPPGEGWLGCGSGFAAHGDVLKQRIGPRLRGVDALVHPSAAAVAKLAAPRLAAGEGIDAALAAPVYVREKVALTTAELSARRGIIGAR